MSSNMKFQLFLTLFFPFNHYTPQGQLKGMNAMYSYVYGSKMVIL